MNNAVRVVLGFATLGLTLFGCIWLENRIRRNEGRNLMLRERDVMAHNLLQWSGQGKNRPVINIADMVIVGMAKDFRIHGYIPEYFEDKEKTQPSKWEALNVLGMEAVVVFKGMVRNGYIEWSEMEVS